MLDSTDALKSWQDKVERLAKSPCPENRGGLHDWWPSQNEDVVFCTLCGREIRKPFDGEARMSDERELKPPICPSCNERMLDDREGGMYGAWFCANGHRAVIIPDTETTEARMSERVEEIRERVEKAKEGPWQWFYEDASMQVLAGPGDYHEPEPLTGHVLAVNPCEHCQKRTVESGEFNRCLGPDEDNAAFIANARQDIPYLLDHLSSTRERLARVERAFQAAKDYIDKSPCDPDINPGQWETWERYQEALQHIRDNGADR